MAELLGVKPGSITDHTPFVNDLGADSLDMVELIMEIEEELESG
jgi:acyl carrier protein